VSERPLLAVENLTKHYPVTEGLFRREVGRVRAVDGVSFELAAGETLGLVGESGCGKSTVAETLLRLEEPTDGRVFFDGRELTAFDEAELTAFRREAQLILQDPTGSFDPRQSIGESVTEPLRIHGLEKRERRRAIGTDLLERVGLEASDYDRYPHEFSGGQKQRIAIARALSVNPRLIVADEPVSALDVSVKADVLELLGSLQAELGIAIVFISHDLSVVREVADRVAVMYLGELVEQAPTERLFADPKHPYTETLLASIPEPDPAASTGDVALSGSVPSARDPPDGCRFHTRCPKVIQPPDLDLDGAVWRQLLDARERIATGDLGLGVAFDRYAAETGTDRDSLDTAQRVRAVRSALDVPDRLADPAAERALSDALEAVVDGDAERALERLREVVRTPCERDNPELRPVEDDPDHEAACLLYEDWDPTGSRSTRR